MQSVQKLFKCSALSDLFGIMLLQSLLVGRMVSLIEMVFQLMTILLPSNSMQWRKEATRQNGDKEI